MLSCLSTWVSRGKVLARCCFGTPKTDTFYLGIFGSNELLQLLYPAKGNPVRYMPSVPIIRAGVIVYSPKRSLMLSTALASRAFLASSSSSVSWRFCADGPRSENSTRDDAMRRAVPPAYYVDCHSNTAYALTHRRKSVDRGWWFILVVCLPVP
jgi:hypothetical protein